MKPLLHSCLLLALASLATANYYTTLNPNYNVVKCFGVHVLENNDEDLNGTSEIDICWSTAIVAAIALIAAYGATQYFERKG